MVRSPDIPARMRAYQEIMATRTAGAQRASRLRPDQPDPSGQGRRSSDHASGSIERMRPGAVRRPRHRAAGMMGFIARFLAHHPGHCKQLVYYPSLIPQAIEELLRAAPHSSIGRKLTQDVTLDGVTMKAGDRVMITACMHGLDERAWPDPLKVDFHRNMHDHMASARARTNARRPPGTR